MKYIAAFFLLASSLLVVGQMPQTTSLEDGDVRKFIKTYEPLSKELDALGTRFDNIQNYTLIQALSANNEVRTVFAKYGWDENWLGKFTTLSISYSIVKMEQQLAEMSNEERKQFEEYMTASFGPLKEMVSEKDIKMVREQIEELDVLFDNQ